MTWSLIGNIAFKGEPGKDGEDGSNGNDGLTPSLSIGQVSTVAPGQPATASISGPIEDLKVNLEVPRGADGKTPVLQGGVAEALPSDAAPTVKTRTDSEGRTLIDVGVPAGQKGGDGKAPIIQGGSAKSLPSDSAPTVEARTSSDGKVLLDIGVPAGVKGNDGGQGLPASPGVPVKRTLNLGTVYQANDKTKPAQIYVNTDVSFQLTLLALAPSSEVELRIGPSSTGLAAGTSGFPVARTRLALTGLTAVVGMALGTGDQLAAQLPTGWYFVVRVVSGSGVTITSAFDQPLA